MVSALQIEKSQIYQQTIKKLEATLQLDQPRFAQSTAENPPKGMQWYRPQAQAEPKSHKS